MSATIINTNVDEIDLIERFKNEWQHSDLHCNWDEGDIMAIIGPDDIDFMPQQTSEDGIDDVKAFWKDSESFYDNLKEIFHFQTGQRDGDDWNVLGQFSNGVFFYITAWCDYTGFDCQSGVRVHCSRDLDLLKKMGIVQKWDSLQEVSEKSSSLPNRPNRE